jgi:hypothetical protein
VFRRSQNEAKMKKRLYRMMNREMPPLEMIPPLTLLRWLFAESLGGNFAPWNTLGRTLRFGREVLRQQSIVDRALASAKNGTLDYSLPRFSS